MASLGFEAGERVLWDGGSLDVGNGAIRIDLSRARVYKKERLLRKNPRLGADTIEQCARSCGSSWVSGTFTR